MTKKGVTLLAALPGGGHSSRTVRVGPDGRIYLALSIAGNCDDQYLGADYTFEDRRGGVLVLNEQDGKTHWEAYASGLRNPVGFDWHPKTGALYASNNGPDHLGFELTRFCGHFIVWEGGVHYVRVSATVSGAVSPTDGRVGTGWP